MTSAFGTVLISALTSGVVALGIEWAAKPRLEARKERFLEQHTKRRNFDKYLLRLRVISAKWATFERGPDSSEPMASRLEAERRRALGQVEEITKAFVDDLEFYAMSYVGTRVPRLISEYVAVARVVQLSDLSPTRRLDLLQEITTPIHVLLFGRWWQVRTRRTTLEDLPKILKKCTSEVTHPRSAPGLPTSQHDAPETPG